MSGYPCAVINASPAFQFRRSENVWDALGHPFIDIGTACSSESFDVFRDFSIGVRFALAPYLDDLPRLAVRGSSGIAPKRFESVDILGRLGISITSSFFY